MFCLVCRIVCFWDVRGQYAVSLLMARVWEGEGEGRGVNDFFISEGDASLVRSSVS